MRYRHRWGLAAVTTMLLLVAGLVGGPASASAADPSWQYTRTGLAPLTNARQWVLVGTKQSSGACRYQYPSGEAAVPASGWTLRTIAIDMIGCRKLFEEGVPTSFSTDAGDGSAQALVAGPAAASSMAAVSTKSAWQRVIWRDLAGLLTTAVMVEITWNYNGSTVSAGSTRGAWQFNTATRWQLTAHTLTDLYGSGSSYYRGQSTATFYNNYFCAPLPAVHTYYYYVRMWGHPNGTSTRDQSSDSVDECLPLHVDIESAYGTWPG